MENEPDWTQHDPEDWQIDQWMTEQSKQFHSAEELAWAAYNHFSRPYHLNVLIHKAKKILSKS